MSVPRDKNEPVRLTRIYTRGGDAGETSLGDGSRASKLDPRIGAYGVVDELNSQLGVVLSGALPEQLRDPLTLSTVQEMSANDIAEILRIKPAVVRSRLFRAREILREKLSALLRDKHGT